MIGPAAFTAATTLLVADLQLAMRLLRADLSGQLAGAGLIPDWPTFAIIGLRTLSDSRGHKVRFQYRAAVTALAERPPTPPRPRDGDADSDRQLADK